MISLIYHRERKKTGKENQQEKTISSEDYGPGDGPWSQAVGPFQLLVPQSETLCQISSGTRPSVQTVSDVCLKHTCSLDTSAFSALEVLDDHRAL